MSLKDLRPFGHVSGLPLIKGQTCFLALDPADDLLILAENYQVKLPRQALIAIIEVRKRQLKPFIRGLQRLASQADSPSASKAQHLLHALKFAVPMAWKGFFLLELRGEHDANLLILRPLWGSRSGEIFDQTVLSPLHLQSDQVLTELSRDSEEKQRDKLKEAGQELSPATAQPFLLPPHTLHKVDLAKPAHIDKEDYYES
ncbi:MAG: hypothetical protein Q4D97_00310 [Eubacteriales bacterium]|nr:hypothetical protein [Eubacteriales bacterium]